MAWLHTSGSLVSGKAGDDDGLRTIKQRRKCLTRKGCPVSRSSTRANRVATKTDFFWGDPESAHTGDKGLKC